MSQPSDSGPLPEDDGDGSASYGSDLSDVQLVGVTDDLAPAPAFRPAFSLQLGGLQRDDAEDADTRRPNLAMSAFAADSTVAPTPRLPPSGESSGGATGSPFKGLIRSTSKPPMLALENPATESPRPPHHGAFPSTSGSSADHVVVSLLSTAMCITASALSNNAPPGTSLRSYVVARCVQSLGVSPEELKLYEVRELAEGDAVTEGSRVAVQVANSSFSLSAIEELLAERRQLLTISERNSQLAAQKDAEVREQAAKLAKLGTSVAEMQAEGGRWEAKCQGLHGEVEDLRRQLSRANEERRQLYNQLGVLRSNFEQLKIGLSERGHVVKMPPGEGGNGHTGGRGAAQAADAALHLLHKLSEPGTLSKLEHVLSSLDRLDIGQQ